MFVESNHVNKSNDAIKWITVSPHVHFHLNHQLSTRFLWIYFSHRRKKWESFQRIWNLYSIHALWCVHTNTSFVCLYKWANERATNMRIISQLYIFRFSKFKTITQRNVRYFKVIGVKLMKINLEDFCQLVVDRSQFFFRVTKIAFMIIMFVE